MPDLMDEAARTWIAERSLLLAKSINKTTLEALRGQLAAGMEAGESIAQITKRLEGYFIENAKRRAELISRTEVITASNQAANNRYAHEGVEKVEWLTSRDGVVCPECDPLDGQEYPIKEGPRPSLHPNCRCTILPVI